MVEGKRHRVAKAQRHRGTKLKPKAQSGKVETKSTKAQRDEGMKAQRRKIIALCIFVSLCLCAFATLSLGLDQVPWRRNPFLTKEEMNSLRKKEAPTTSSASEVILLPVFPQWEVKSILTSGSSGVATVNDHIVKAGDFLGEEMILEIKEGSVVLGSKGKRRVLRQRQPSVLIKVEEIR